MILMKYSIGVKKERAVRMLETYKNDIEAIKDSIQINEKGDTTWFKKAEKLFRNVDEINLTYKLDSGANKASSRHAAFRKSFKTE